MTVPELIAAVLSQLENQFYCDLPRRDFKRDEKYLVVAISTYGHECNQRDWQFDAGFIYQELCRILRSFKHSGTKIEWMPNYLQMAIRQHIREHAEELQSEARSQKLPRAIRHLVGTLCPVTIIEKTPAEQMATLYADVKRLRRQAGASKKAVKAETKRQGVLL